MKAEAALASQELRVDARVVSVASGEVEWRGGYSLRAAGPLDLQGRIAAALADEPTATESALRAGPGAGREALPPV
jgi:hypothetical protein